MVRRDAQENLGHVVVWYVSLLTYCIETVSRFRLRLLRIIVYSCVASSPACVAETGYFPVSNVPSNDLGVAGKNIKRHFCLGSIKLSDKV